MFGDSALPTPAAPEHAAGLAASGDAVSHRVKVADKRIINGQTDVNQLVPFKYKWAWEKYLATCANHWMPQKSTCRATSPSGRTRTGSPRTSAASSSATWVSSSRPTRWPRTTSCWAPTATSRRPNAASSCCARRSRKRSTPAYQYIVESLDLDEAEIFNAYNEVPSIRAKDEFLIPFIDAIADPNFKTGTPEADQTLLKSLIVFACLMEGLFFYVGFTQILALGRQNKMTGAAERYMYILRDESMHCNFGIDLINTIKLENPHLWTPEFREEIRELFRKAVELEYAYAEDTMPRGVLGLALRCSSPTCASSPTVVANRSASNRCWEENPFPWMAEMIDLKKNATFETRVIEYQTGGTLSWE